MNFILTPGVYAALNLLSKAARSKVIEAAFAFVICGVRPTGLSKNLLVMFMMVVDSASEGRLTYTPDEEKSAEATVSPEDKQQPEPETTMTPEKKKKEQVESPCPRPANGDKVTAPLAGIRRINVHHRRKKSRQK